MKASTSRAFALVAVAAVVAAVIAGLKLIRSPGEERERRVDARRVSELRTIANGVDLYWTREGRLPVSLDELRAAQLGGLYYEDPETRRPYEYRVLGDKGYELCAEFVRHPGDEGRHLHGDFWTHGAGRQCYRLDARKVVR